MGDDQRLNLLCQLVTEAADDRRELLDCLRDAVVLALVGVVPAKDTIARWNDLIKKAEDRQ